MLGKEYCILPSGEKVCLQLGENNFSKSQLISVMNKFGITDREKINDIFNHLAVEFYVIKFIRSYKEFYIESDSMKKIEQYLSKISFELIDGDKEKLKEKISIMEG